MPDSACFTLEYPEPDIALLTFDTPQKKVNVLSRAVLEEFSTRLDEVAQRDGLAGLVVRSGKPGNFIAGADLTEFGGWLDAPPEKKVELCRRGQQLFARLAELDLVTVAAIEGTCVGGGAELASWCDRRVFAHDEGTNIGFPEVQLGILPGWGGTARLPRIVGLSNAIEMITGGETIDAEEAYVMGLANDLVNCGDVDESDALQEDQRCAKLLRSAILMVRAEQESGAWQRDRKTWSGPINISETELGFLGATASAVIQQKTKGHYPAPQAALEVMLGAAGETVENALQMEAGAFSELFGTPVNRSLINVYFLRDENKKDPGVAVDAKTRAIERASVVGAGVMGQGIAAANIKRGVPVGMADISEDFVRKGISGVLDEVSYNKKTKRKDGDRAMQFAPLLSAAASDQDVAAADIVIEAIAEKLDIKREFYGRIEPLMDDAAILCSNTSTIPITKLAEGLTRPERFCGLHFFNPVRRMQLVEVIRGAQTSDETIATSVQYAKRIGKSPIVVGDGPGFLVNRLLLPYMNEALQLLAEGASIKQVERAAKTFGMPMGPITLLDVVGLDIAVHAGKVMYEAFPNRIIPSDTLAALYKAGRLGQKSGAGFFAYPKGNDRPQPDPEVEQLIGDRIREKKEWTEEALIDRMFLPMIVEATRVLEAKLVRHAKDVDLGLIFGIGFPPFRGGLLFWADSLGAKNVVEKLRPLANLGARYEITPLLEKLAANDATFYSLERQRIAVGK